ncbi:MAG: polysaccharide deacetylase family protein [Opitutaceae bacterium]|nr:polysaccharide deacetylase family protein [Opitutaceae bacterium]
MKPLSVFVAAALLAAACLVSPAKAAQPVPDKLVVLTFDDSCASHYTVAAPLLKRYGFGATFFITEGFTFRTNKRDYMTWEQIAELHRDGFEIGNHTRDHMSVTEKSVPRLAEQLEAIAARCREHGIPVPVSFAWPGNRFHASALPVLQQAGIRFARRGGEPEVPYALGGGVAYEPRADHPLLVPTAGDARPDWTLDNLKRALALGGRGRIPVLQFHGVPDGEHPWVNTPRDRFEEYMAWLHREGYTVIALRDLARYTEGKPIPADPLAIMEARRRAAAAAPVFSSDKELIDVRDAAKVRARRPLLIAHRGGVVSSRIPEGSLAAIREAARHGYDMVELDVRVTKDDVPVIFHDANLLTATGHNGPIGELTEAGTRTIRFRKNDEAIANLEQALGLCRQLHLGVMLDLKDPPRTEMLQKIAALVRKHGLEKSTVTISGHPLVRTELGGVALVPVNADELKKVTAGEPISLAGRLWFGIPAWIPFETIPKLQRAGALVFPAINLFRYENDPGRAQARRDVQALTELGVEGFQIDSAYQDFFGQPLPE